MGRRSGGAGEPLRAMCAPRARRRARNAREGTFRPGQAARSARSATARARGGALILFGPMASFLGGRLLACMTPLLGPTTGPRLCMGRAYGVARGCCGGGSGRAADGVLDQVCGNDYRSCRHVVPCGAALRVSCGCSCRSACRRSSISCHDALALLTPRACLPAAAAPPPTAVAGGIALSSGR